MSKFKGGICDTRCQQFHREAVNKAEKLKTLWFIKNKKRLYDNLASDKFAPKIKVLPPVPKFIEDRKFKIEKPVYPPWRPLTQEANHDIMKPIKPSVKNIFYAPKDASFVSKNKYFRERYKEKPEDKFYFPQCSSWIIGWRLKDYPQTTVSEYGVRSVIQSSFYRKNASSLQHDPDWYRMCQTGNPKNYHEQLSY